ncbi:MAG: 4-hydroxybenzoate polyprenyltransferase, mitochondrial [Chlamydiales bacterium]|nr:4-hydroxybenzoate polyprenyltransferase, mitochondrial [Chlamydiales bacterium]MCH9634871.1 4-hydroxybenzoate polyprenyltransferase, mitochondrial [Chlamydiales bacterium]
MLKQKLTFATFKELTRLELSLFGLPYVIGGALLPLASFHFFASFQGSYCLRFLWLLPAFLAARTAGMAFNQMIDAKIDAKNARTQDRPIPSGRATIEQTGQLAWTALFAFVIICAFINQACLILSFIAAPLIVLYSYMKRIHMSCHFVLGAIHLLGPVMAAALLSNSFCLPAFYLGLIACFSIAANDITYAIQDHQFDIHERLHSIPAKLGVDNALWIARGCHLLVIICYYYMAKSGHFPKSSLACVPILGYIYYRFHQKLLNALREEDVSKIPELFKSCNITVPLVVLFFIGMGVLWSSA